MNLKTERIEKLERDILSYLVFLDKEDLIEELANLDFDLWSKDYQRMLDLLRYYTTIDNPDGDATDLLVHEYRPIYIFTDIINNFVPSYLGREYVQELIYLREENKYKRKLRELSSKNLDVILPELYNLSKTPVSAYKPRTLLETAQERLKERKLEATAPSTGYADLDRFIKGFIPGHIYVLSGDTNSGKTTLCLNFVHRISQQGKTSLYFALEPENTIVDYLASIRLEKRFDDLKDEDMLYEDHNISIFGKESIRKIEDLVKAVNSLPRFDLVIVDHIGYFTSGTSNLTSKQSDVMKDLAGLAKSKNCAVMLVQHLNKAKFDKASPENSITGSAAFKQDATDVLILTRDKEENDYGVSTSLNTGAILIRKSKSDMSQGSVPVRFVHGSALILDNKDTDTFL